MECMGLQDNTAYLRPLAFGTASKMTASLRRRYGTCGRYPSRPPYGRCFFFPPRTYCNVRRFASAGRAVRVRGLARCACLERLLSLTAATAMGQHQKTAFRDLLHPQRCIAASRFSAQTRLRTQPFPSRNFALSSISTRMPPASNCISR
jgi:hypothetical protein